MESAGRLTIKFQAVVPDALQPCPTTSLFGQSAMTLGFTKVVLQHEEQRCRHDREDDGEAAKSPPPADVVVEVIRGLGSRECGDHVRRGCESVRQPSVLQSRGVRRDDIDAVCHAAEPDGVEYLGHHLSALEERPIKIRYSHMRRRMSPDRYKWSSGLEAKGVRVSRCLKRTYRSMPIDMLTQAKRRKDCHHQEAFSSAPDVHDFR